VDNFKCALRYTGVQKLHHRPFSADKANLELQLDVYKECMS